MKTDIIDLKKKHPDFNRFGWLLSALSKHPCEKRPHVIYLYCEKNLLVCTDGDRIHTYKNNEWHYPGGYYNVILNSEERIFLAKNEETREYPEFEEILIPPDVEPFLVYADHDFECSNVFAHILRRLTKNHIHYKFLWDLLRFGHHFDCYVGGETDPIVFIQNNMKAAIMPMAERK